MSSATKNEGELSPLKRALLAMDQMQARLDAAEKARREPIAVIGMGCRFPGAAHDPASFWNLLRSGVDAIGEVPPDRWDIDAYYSDDPDAPGKMYTRWGGFLSDIDQFDPEFFGITPREAASLDPQQRLLLEVTWEALENAARAPDSLAGSRTGVFVGILSGDYGDLQLTGDGVERLDAYFGSGTARSIASGRLSYVLGLRGPSLSIDTACSSSLVALHLACASLRRGETDMAIAAGVNLMLMPEPTIALSRYRMMAADGRCKAFDRRADGYVRGEGCAALILKTLSAARRDGDRVLAVVRGTAVNQDGASSGLTAPNGPAQEDVIRDALKDASLRPEQVTYIEAHGTGTSLGDPIEIQALAHTLGQGRGSADPLLVGTVKTNIGHTESAAGLAGVVKAILALQHREIPPNLHFDEPNPFIAWNRLPVAIPRTLTPWPAGRPLIAGVSSFGFSGTNAHVLLEAADEAAAEDVVVERPLHVLTLSAVNEEALRLTAGRYEQYLEAAADVRWEDVCFTANAGRVQQPHRALIVARDRTDALPMIRQLAAGQDAPEVARAHVRGTPSLLAWLFTGQGAQYPEMGRAFYETQPVFRQVIDRCDALLRVETGTSLLEVIHSHDGRLDQTINTQPALYALECALAEMWRSWGIAPAAVLGHSVGEYVAAYVAGVFSLEDGLRLIAARARLLQSLPAGGRMAALPLDADAAARAIAGHEHELSVAAVNGPSSTVISGAGSAIDAVIDSLASAGITARPLMVSHAFHSPLLDSVLDEFERIAGTIEYAAPRIRLVSNVTGKVADAGVATTPRYWREHMRSTVKFAAGVAELRRQGFRLFLELGPAGVLSTLGRQTAHDAEFVSTMARDTDAWRQTLDALGRLYCAGVSVDWEGFDGCYRRRRLALPTTPFQRSRHWVQLPAAGTRHAPAQAGARPLHPLLHRPIESPLDMRQYASELDRDSAVVIRDHVVAGQSILPATAFVEIALAAGRHGSPDGRAPSLEGLAIREPMPFPDGETRDVHVVVEDDAPASFSIYSRSGSPGSQPRAWTLHAQGTYATGAGEAVAPLDIDAVRARCPSTFERDQHYAQLRRRGYAFGPSLQGVQQVWRGNGEALARVELPSSARSDAGEFIMPPALLDACLQFCWALLSDDAAAVTYLPLSVNSIRVLETPPARVWSHARIRAGRPEQGTFTADVCVADDEGRVVAELSGILFQRARTDLGQSGRPIDEWLYELQWEEAPLPDLSPLAAAAPTHELSLAAIGEFVEGRLAPLAEEHGLAHHNRLIRELERLSIGYVAQGFARIGIAMDVGSRLVPDDLMREHGILPKYGRLLRRLLAMFEEDGVLERAGAEWVVRRPPAAVDTTALLERLQAEHPGAHAQLELTARCGEQFGEAITGKADPLALLFPGGSLDVAERLYRELPEARVFNELAASAVAEAVQQLPAGRPIRVIELGAGTGGLTSYVLPHLPADRTEYTFTDVSPAFLSRARRKFEQYPFVQYGLCDAEKPCDEQGHEAGGFDIVIAANALHATRDMHRTMSNARRLLAPHGALVLLEGTGPERWIDITFGLTDGWWAFTDSELRPDYPLLTRDMWRRVLDDVGFAAVDVLPQPTELSRQAVVVAANSQAEATADSAACLIVADGQGVAASLEAALAARGRTCRVLRTRASDNGAPAIVDLEDPAAVARAVRDAGAFRDVVYLSALDALDPALVPLSSLEPAERSACSGLLHLVQALGASRAGAAPRLWVVTSGAQAVGGESMLQPLQATLLGFSKVIDLEHPDLACTRVDLDPALPPAAQAQAVAHEIEVGGRENQIAYRAGGRRVVRLVASADRGEQPAPDTHQDAVMLRASSSGVLDDLEWVPMHRDLPAAGMVEIEVQASGLAFRDVLNALAMRRDDDPLGSEVAGVVTAVGDGVEDFVPGDDVVALATGGFASFVMADASLAVHRPERLSAEEAVTLPTAAVTALHALKNVAAVGAGERVLIHAASGGVGMAAVQIARMLGAEVFATAGTEAKRRYLRSIGVKHVFDSRTLGFVREIGEVTGGAGVDVVLNSLSGDFIPASLSVLGAGGRFLEIGKRDIWTAEQVAAQYPHVRYTVIDLASGGTESKDTLAAVLRQVFVLAAAGELEPLPIRLYERNAARNAFRDMAQARHIGKIVVVHDGSGARRDRFRTDATYLITGGLSGLGLLTAEWMVDNGARHLVLMGRRAPGEAARESITKMQADGAHVRIESGDVSDATTVQRMLDAVAEEMPPLRGIIHAAGVLDDGVLMRQEWSRFAGVMAPKVDGAWYLHALTLNRPLDFFIMYSSLAGVMGSSGQANHAAANAFMDALAHERRAAGRPALSIDWGVWSEIGAAAERQAGDWVGRQGVSTIAPHDGLRVLERLLQGRATQVAVLPVDWTRYLQQFPAGAPAWLSNVANTGFAEQVASRPARHAAPAVKGGASLRDRLVDAPESRRVALVEEHVSEQVRLVIGGNGSRSIDPEKPLNELGLDSLMAVELRNRLSTSVSAARPLPATLVFDYPTIAAIARFVLEDLLQLAAPTTTNADTAPSDPDDLLSAIEQLPEDSVAAASRAALEPEANG